jgi:ion channel POLLUX/CASTOR
MKKHSSWAYFRYRFDNFMSRGTISLVLALFAFTLLMILTAAIIIRIANLPVVENERIGFGEALWQATMRTIDTGTVAGDNAWSFRWVAFLVTLGGIFITSALISILANGLDTRLNELRRGRSHVVESGHIVVLGWSAQVFTILSELAIVNRQLSGQRQRPAGGPAGERASCVAILADKIRSRWKRKSA